MRSGAIWNDNFTKGVRVSNVRLFTGQPTMDPVTGRLRLDNQRVVRPSRIVFLKNLLQSDTRIPDDILNHADEATQRCYVDPTKLDEDIVLTRCRTSPGSINLSFDTVPTYLKSHVEDQLTWVAEFKAGEGADFDPTTPTFDPVPTGAVLAIEFTIEKVQ